MWFIFTDSRLRSIFMGLRLGVGARTSRAQGFCLSADPGRPAGPFSLF
jgi:hypothetical protein